MRIFIAGGSGAIGRALVPLLTNAGHAVVALTRSEKNAAQLAAMGAAAVIGNVFQSEQLRDYLESANPEIVIHQLTAFGATADPLAETNRVRIEGTRNLLAAAKTAGAKRFIAQSISFVCTPHGEGLTDETTPLYADAPPAMQPLVNAVAELERQVLHADGIEGIVLRYGWFYGPGTNYDIDASIPRSVRLARAPIVGGGAGTYSFIHVKDAAQATVCALTKGGTGIYHIVDDEPALQREWLPYLASLLKAPSPQTTDETSARKKLGDMMVYFMNEQRGTSGRKAREELGWQPQIPSWREGFRDIFS